MECQLNIHSKTAAIHPHGHNNINNNITYNVVCARKLRSSIQDRTSSPIKDDNYIVGELPGGVGGGGLVCTNFLANKSVAYNWTKFIPLIPNLWTLSGWEWWMVSVVVLVPRLEFRNTSTGSIIHYVIISIQCAHNSTTNRFKWWWHRFWWLMSFIKWGLLNLWELVGDYYLALSTFMLLEGYLPESVLITGDIIMCRKP